MKRRLNEEGSVYFDPTRNRYRVTARITDEEGVSKRLTFYGPTAAQALEKMRNGKAHYRRGGQTGKARISLATWLDQWSGGPLESSTRKETTKDGYRYMAKHLQAHPIAKKELRKIRPSHIQGFLSDMRKTSLSNSTIRHVYATLKVVFNDAITARIIADNPASDVSPPPRGKTAPTFLTSEETKALLDAARPDRYYVAIRLLAQTGLRRGEALALRWEDIDFAKGTLWARGTLARSAEGLYITSPKTRASIRQLYMPQDLVSLLQSHQLAQKAEIAHAGNRYLEKGFVFATLTGEPVDPRNLQRSVQIAGKRAGLPKVSPHTLRHSAATTMLEAGIPIHVVSRQLGHSSINITVDIYGHVSDHAAKAAMEKLGQLLNS